MAIEIVMPKLGLTMTEGLIVGWLKKEGDIVKKGDGVLEIETEKLTNVIESPADGTILKILYEAGEALPIAATLAYVGNPGEVVPDAAAGVAVPVAVDPMPAAPEQAKVNTGSGRSVKASPAARALARSLGIDYTALVGTGPGGRIVKKDIENATCADASASVSTAAESVSVQPYAGMRKAVGEGMRKSWTTAPMVTHHVKADVTALLALRGQLNQGIQDGEVKVGLTDLFVKIVSRTIRDYPVVGATLSGNEIHLPGKINIGVAVAVDNGLLVPVVKDATAKSLFAVGRELQELIRKARSGGLTGPEMSGGTFTISNLGGYGSVDFFTPIINQPESAILGVCRTVQEPVVRNGEIVIRSMMGLSFTFDHRVIDGAPAAEFLAALLKYLEMPARAVFED